MRFEVSYHPATQGELRAWGHWLREQYPGQDALIVGVVELIPVELAGRLEEWWRGLEPEPRVRRPGDVVTTLRRSPPPDTRERTDPRARASWVTVLHSPTEVTWVVSGVARPTRWARLLASLPGRARTVRATWTARVEIVHLTAPGPARPRR
jgi:hypothetical protein